MTWQAPGAPPADPFAAIEADVRAMTSSPWWMGAMPPQRAEAVTARMLAGAGEWWLFGVWGRWYRCGLDGNWHPCPPPFDPAARRAVMPAPPGAGRPPVPPTLVPLGPDLTPGPLAGDGLFGAPPSPQLLARLQQVTAAAAAVNPAQFPLRDPHFAPGTPSPIAACFFTVLWCAGAPVAEADHPLLGLFGRYLAGAGQGPRWFLPPDLAIIAGAYTERLRAGDPMGAAHVARTVWETAETLRAEPAFRPRADAMAAMAGATLQMVQADQGGIRFGDQTVIREWLRRCPPQFQIAMLRETAPGDHLRLGLYDLAAAAAALPAAVAGPAEARRVALALLAADLDGVPGSVSAVMPWLDPESVRNLQALGRPDNPLRRLWPVDGTLPDAVAGADPQILRALLAASYVTALAWCRLAGMAPPRPGFTVPAALMRALQAAPGHGAGGNLTPWEIIEAARAHLAEQRKADSPPPEQPATTAWPGAGPGAAPPAGASDPGRSDPGVAPPGTSDPGRSDPSGAAPVTSGPGRPVEPAPPGGVPPAGGPGTGPQPATTAWPGTDSGGAAPPAGASDPGRPSAERPAVPPTAVTPDPGNAPSGEPPSALSPGPPLWSAAAPTAISSGDAPSADPPADPAPGAGSAGPPPAVTAHGITFLPGPDDVERLLTELRRRGKWALSLRGQEVSSASAPAVLLVGDVSCGQRRLTRMIARALADVGVGDGEVHTLTAEDLAEIDPKELRGRLGDYGGHTLLVEGLDTLVLDDDRGEAYGSALYRARVEGVSDTILTATCAPDRLRALTDAVPELVADFRTVRLPDLADPETRVRLAALLAAERHLELTPDAWQAARRDLAALRGRGRLTNARLVEAYLDRACTRHLSRAGETQVFQGEGGLTLSADDFAEVAAELEP